MTHFLGWRRSPGWRLSFSGMDSSFLILASNHLITSQLQEIFVGQRDANVPHSFLGIFADFRPAAKMRSRKVPSIGRSMQSLLSEVNEMSALRPFFC